MAKPRAEQGRSAIAALPKNAMGQTVYRLDLPSRNPIYLTGRDIAQLRRALAELEAAMASGDAGDRAKVFSLSDRRKGGGDAA